jgi:hypothetical protein
MALCYTLQAISLLDAFVSLQNFEFDSGGLQLLQFKHEKRMQMFLFVKQS